MRDADGTLSAGADPREEETNPVEEIDQLGYYPDNHAHNDTCLSSHSERDDRKPCSPRSSRIRNDHSAP